MLARSSIRTTSNRAAPAWPSFDDEARWASRTASVTAASQLKSESSQSWCTNADATVGGMPYTVAAKLAAKLGCDLQAPVPIRGTQALYDEIARQLASVAGFKGTIEAEVGNENWNGSYNSREWLANVYGKAQNPPLSAAQAEAQKALMWFRALSAVMAPHSAPLLRGQLLDGFWPGATSTPRCAMSTAAASSRKARPFTPCSTRSASHPMSPRRSAPRSMVGASSTTPG